MFCQSLEGLIAWFIILVIIVAVLNWLTNDKHMQTLMGAGGIAWLVILGMFVLSNSGIAKCERPELQGMFPGSVAAAAVTAA
jgi:hypothetical protein